MIIVAGSLELKPGRRDEFLRASTEAVRAARAAPGCIEFAVAADPLEADRVVVYERWTSRDLLDAFRGSGPPGELDDAVLAYHVAEYTVVPDEAP